MPTWIKRTSGLAAAVCLACASHTASADARLTSTTDSGQWYAWQNLSVDASAAALLVTALELDDADHDAVVALGLAGAAALTFGSPIVHWAHGNVELGFTSLGLRGTAWLSLLTWALAELGCLDYEGEGSCGGGDAWLGLAALSGCGAVIVDLAFGRERLARDAPASGLRPTVRMHSQALILGLDATFD